MEGPYSGKNRSTQPTVEENELPPSSSSHSSSPVLTGYHRIPKVEVFQIQGGDELRKSSGGFSALAKMN